MTRDEIAIRCLVAMLTGPQPGDKEAKIRAAFTFADMFLMESVTRSKRDLSGLTGDDEWNLPSAKT